ncbi:MAG TPA: hypothetical protein DD405_05040 [Desulfobacteraceae bacterium]|nr:hypothetical protein [Desulfobacteraceae bacterium]
MQSRFSSFINVFVALFTFAGSDIRSFFIERLPKAKVNGWQEWGADKQRYQHDVLGHIIEFPLV